MKKLRVTVEGKVYEVLAEVLDDQPAAAPVPNRAPAAMAPLAAVAAPAKPVAAAAAAAPVAGAVPSPLSGKIVSIDVQPGATVAVGAQLVTLEAMKMNTFVYADRAGTVTAIHVSAGDGVEEGAPLLTLG